MVGSLAMSVFVLVQAPDWDRLPKALCLGALASLAASGFAETRAASTMWRFHQTNAEDIRRETDFSLGGFRASLPWRRVRNCGLLLFLVLAGLLTLLFGH